MARNFPNDWRNPQNDNLWQGINGINNPCPSGYRIPTYSELEAERSSWSANNSIGAFSSPLKLSMAGRRSLHNGTLINIGFNGTYWTNTVITNTKMYTLDFTNSAGVGPNERAFGFSVRCIKN